MSVVELREIFGCPRVTRDALAQLSVDAAAAHAPRWLPTAARARETIDEAMGEDHVTYVLLDEGAPLGWGSIFPAYGAVWELHPLLVHPDHQRRGHGERLVRALEAGAAAGGACVVALSTSDETGATSLSNVDLYEDPLGALQDMTHAPGHAVGFWLRMGYRLVGVTPDAEGPGKPSIHFARRP